MNTVNRTSRVLGVAFLLQFVTSLFCGTILRQAWFVAGNLGETMLNIANKPWMMQATILVDVLTAFSVIFLGAILFVSLRKQNEKIALVAMGFYILEAALLVVSRIEAFSLMGISQEFVTTGSPAYLLTMGKLTFESMDFVGSTLHMLAFCFGGILFHYLLYRSGIVPRGLSLWGLITVFPCLAGTQLAVFGYQVPFFIYLPYAPFELVIAI
ncbi:MAG: DUF4386 domain-containing protein [Bacteroidales bacterium]|jgi:hypothetical protein